MIFVGCGRGCFFTYAGLLLFLYASCWGQYKIIGGAQNKKIKIIQKEYNTSINHNLIRVIASK